MSLSDVAVFHALALDPDPDIDEDEDAQHPSSIWGPLPTTPPPPPPPPPLPPLPPKQLLLPSMHERFA